MPSKSKSKVTSLAGKPRKSAAKPKSPPKAGSKLKPDAAAKQKTRSVGDWRAEILAEVRRIIQEADPEIVEEVKWIKPTNPAGVPVWSHAGIVCTGETYKQVVKLTFARGASLKDPQGLFNSSLDGNTRRAIDIREGEKLNAQAFSALIQAAVAENLRASASKTKDSPKAAAKPKAGVSKPKPRKLQKGENGVVLLSGGNPQIAKAYGDAPVQDYIDAMPGWKRDVGRRLDAIISKTVPNVFKAVKWNTPFYGVEDGVWFLGFHCITKYIKVAFFRGTSLNPVPPVESKQKEVRYFHIQEGDAIDKAQFASWVKQASKLPGEKM